MADVYVQQYYRSREPWPPVDGFKVMVDDQIELDADTLLEAVEFMVALAMRLEGKETQGSLNFELGGSIE